MPERFGIRTCTCFRSHRQLNEPIQKLGFTCGIDFKSTFSVATPSRIMWGMYDLRLEKWSLLLIMETPSLSGTVFRVHIREYTPKLCHFSSSLSPVNIL